MYVIKNRCFSLEDEIIAKIHYLALNRIEIDKIMYDFSMLY